MNFSRDFRGEQGAQASLIRKSEENAGAPLIAANAGNGAPSVRSRDDHRHIDLRNCFHFIADVAVHKVGRIFSSTRLERLEPPTDTQTLSDRRFERQAASTPVFLKLMVSAVL